MLQKNMGKRRFYERSDLIVIEFTDGSANGGRCPNVQYELSL